MTVISVAISTVALPPLLALLGERVNRGAVPGRAAAGSSSVARAVTAALRRPAVAAIVVAVPLVLLALPAVSFNTGPPGIDELSSANPARQAAETIDRAVGPGWESPFVLVAATESGPITQRKTLDLLARTQRRIAARPGVRAVIGPAPVLAQARPLRSLGAKLTGTVGGAGDGGKEGSSPEDLEELGPGLRRAAGAVAELRSGLADGAAGSGLLAEGSERAAKGAGVIASELRRAAGRGEEATGAIELLAEGSRKLAEGQQRTSVGTLTLALGLRSLLPRVRGGELARSRKLARRLELAAASDPSLRKPATEARTLARAIALTRTEVRRLREVAREVNGALNRLVPGGRELEGWGGAAVPVGR